MRLTAKCSCRRLRCACAVPAVEGGEALPLEELSSLLFDDTTPRSLFVTHRMMQRDTLYFKQVRGLGRTMRLTLCHLRLDGP